MPIKVTYSKNIKHYSPVSSPKNQLVIDDSHFNNQSQSVVNSPQNHMSVQGTGRKGNKFNNPNTSFTADS